MSRTQIGRRYKRSLAQLGKDCILPIPRLIEVEAAVADGDMRLRALAHVLRVIPKRDYNRLVSRLDTFRFFIPDRDVSGLIDRFHANVYPEDDSAAPRPYARVVYFSPTLENDTTDMLVAVVAHELAHIVLDHRSR